VTKIIGFDAAEDHRTSSGGTYDVSKDDRYNIVYPLREWDFRRQDALEDLRRRGYGHIRKSSCFICPAAKVEEIRSMPSSEFRRARRVEDTYRSGRHFRGDDFFTVRIAHKTRKAPKGAKVTKVKPDPQDELSGMWSGHGDKYQGKWIRKRIYLHAEDKAAAKAEVKAWLAEQPDADEWRITGANSSVPGLGRQFRWTEVRPDDGPMDGDQKLFFEV
jgi:hypothetical protein